jgi:hypothetical protein
MPTSVANARAFTSKALRTLLDVRQQGKSLTGSWSADSPWPAPTKAPPAEPPETTQATPARPESTTAGYIATPADRHREPRFSGPIYLSVGCRPRVRSRHLGPTAGEIQKMTKSQGNSDGPPDDEFSRSAWMKETNTTMAEFTKGAAVRGGHACSGSHRPYRSMGFSRANGRRMNRSSAAWSRRHRVIPMDRRGCSRRFKSRLG